MLFHSTTIKSNYQPVIHCRTVRQSAAIEILEGSHALSARDRALVRFRFLYRPEYMVVGSKIVFREGRTKGVGTVVAVHGDGMRGLPSDVRDSRRKRR